MASDNQPIQYLAIDFGTSRVKVTIGPASGAPTITTSSPIEYYRPEDGPDVAVEFDPAKALDLVIKTVRLALVKSELEPADIAGIGITSQRQGTVLLNLEGQPLYGGPNHDMRGVYEGQSIDTNALVDVWELTGHGPAVLSSWSRLKWFAANKPEVYERTRTVCGIADWLVLEFTGELLMEQSLAVESGLGLVASGEPARALAPALNLGDIELPATCPPGTVVGKLKNIVAKSLDLPSGIPVVACGPDTQTGLLGLGVQLPNAVGIISGWNTAVQRVTERPVFDDTRSMWTGRHVFENRWVLEGSAGATGGTYNWLLSLVYGPLTYTDVMNTIDDAIAGIKPGAKGVSAFLGPSFVHMANAELRTGGFVFPVPISYDPPDRIQLARAALESFAYGIRFNVERLNSFRGPALDISVGGGMIKTKSFRQILTDVLDCEIRVSDSGETTSLGALSQVAASVGKGPSSAEYAAIRATELIRYEPDNDRAMAYEDLYTEWRHKERLFEGFDI